MVSFLMGVGTFLAGLVLVSVGIAISRNVPACPSSVVESFYWTGGLFIALAPLAWGVFKTMEDRDNDNDQRPA